MRRIRNRLNSEPEIIWTGWGWWMHPRPRSITQPLYSTPQQGFTEAQVRCLADGHDIICCR